MKQPTVLTKSILLLGIGALLLLAACEGGAPTSVKECLSEPALTSPANGAEDVDKSPQFQWSDIDDETGYKVEVFESTNCFGTPDYESGELAANATSHTATKPLKASQTYSWHVIAVTNDLNSCNSSSECRVFTTTASP